MHSNNTHKPEAGSHKKKQRVYTHMNYKIFSKKYKKRCTSSNKCTQWCIVLVLWITPSSDVHFSQGNLFQPMVLCSLRNSREIWRKKNPHNIMENMKIEEAKGQSEKKKTKRKSKGWAESEAKSAILIHYTSTMIQDWTESTNKVWKWLSSQKQNCSGHFRWRETDSNQKRNGGRPLREVWRATDWPWSSSRARWRVLTITLRVLQCREDWMNE